ncbi:MAG TPA: hypothetical protein VFB36_13660 [Nevskiaceae bacterium]|nr:hypothetical protein [Nevskiaceae bacterium]
MSDRNLRGFVLRDGSFTLLTLVAWSVLVQRGGSAAFNVVVGLMTVVAGYLAHEWGHLIGAWTRGSAVVIPKWTSPFLFNFDVGRNSRQQFNAMAMGGFVASIVFVVVIAATLPMHLLASKIAATLTAIGVLATFVLEVPTAWRVFRGAPLPSQGPAFVSTKP